MTTDIYRGNLVKAFLWYSDWSSGEYKKQVTIKLETKRLYDRFIEACKRDIKEQAVNHQVGDVDVIGIYIAGEGWSVEANKNGESNG